MECKLCGKEKLIYKLGCCKKCYNYNIMKVYRKRDYARVRIDTQEELIEEFLKNQRVSKKYLAEKYCISEREVYHIIEKFCEFDYVRRDNHEIILN